MNFGWIEIGLFYGIAVAFGLWQYISMDRKLKQTRAEREAREAAERDSAPDA
ncbi:hypothetical protein [Erythrobacter oryzae]|uniref:hypothetical protein n=1 Tax=Erythrobacter oryzae TaxID=3019556 RepID=UPI0025575E73|nr:hypothetical protein [Erythrobacter sp. COR-2]